MQSLTRNGYTAEEIKAVLHATTGARDLTFIYHLLDSQNKFKKVLTNFLGGNVENNALADIKRTAKFKLLDDNSIDFLKDRIKPIVRLKMPDGGFVDFPQGVFVLSTPPRKVDRTGIVTREIEAYDQLQVLLDDKIDTRYTIAAGSNYITEVKGLLDSAGIVLKNLTGTNKTLPVTKDWEIGTPKLKIINDLLGAINYQSLWFDEEGAAIAQPYVSPSDRVSEYTYKDDGESVMLPDVTHDIDLFDVPNKWIVMVSESDRAPLVSVYTNTNPNSLTSTVNRGRVIVNEPIKVDAVDQTTLDAKAQRLAFEASQIVESIEFKTAIMPIHSNADVITLEFSALGISDKYSEHSWSFELKAGALMNHRIRKVITV